MLQALRCLPVAAFAATQRVEACCFSLSEMNDPAIPGAVACPAAAARPDDRRRAGGAA